MSDRTSQVWGPYLLTCLPGWLIGSAAVWVLSVWFEVPLWAGLVVWALWVLSDLVAFPRMRRFYEPEPAERRIVGKVGTAASDIAPAGFARVHGELWQATVADQRTAITKGARLRVRDIDGLDLIVEPA